ncbi:TonB-dependent receptor [Edaphobacter modestus]|uniref:TonB-dependent receptor-like protein n=1 Tax=Edaphobacter modestus TaxID=388466 RepID=A0A4Q7YTX3_9BACT|nr:carboxypeptidase-like regulatory domain-containing protein [Edaphobacter modestus]RZU41292.1 TonB-dependent receptor-like protein [Edaphobacter modestus]
MFSRLSILFANLFLSSLLTVSAIAQSSGSGTLSGTVTDTSGAVISNADVTVLQSATGLERSTKTNSNGFYSLPALRAGDYVVRAQAPGFGRVEQLGVVLQSDTTRTINLQLVVGGASDTTTVTADAPAIETSEGSLNTIITGTQLRELATNGRNFTQFLSLGTGVSSSQTGQRMGVGQEGNPLTSVNGGRINSNAFTYDGILAMDTGGNRGLNLFPPMEAIQEIQVHKSNYTADIGSFGYSQVNIVTRSGGEKYHGDLYEVFSNDALNARNYFNTVKPPLHDNNFGYDFGGHLLPGAKGSFARNLFFFWSQAFDRRSGPELTSFTSAPQSTFTATTPTAAQRAGNFAGSAPITNPDTGLPYAGNQITNIDPNATLLLNAYFPLPNSNSSSNYVISPKSQTSWREELIRIDATLSPSDTVTLRYAHDAWSQQQAILKPSNQSFATIGGSFSKPGQNGVAQWTHIFSPTLLNQATIGYSRNQITQSPDSNGQRPAGLAIPSLYNANIYNLIPTITISGFSSIGAQGLTNNTNNVYTWRDDVTKQLHNHSLKTGFNILRIQKFDSFPYGGQAGSFSFTGSATGNALADFLTGHAFSYVEQSNVPNVYLFSNMFEAYVQDDWKVTRNLTLNLGVRDTIFQGAPNGYDKYDRISDFVPSLYSAANAPTVTSTGALVAGTGDPLNGIITPANQKGLDLPRSLTGARNNIGPRLGFAWSPFGSSTTSIRGGYGLFYHWDNDNHESLSANPPFAQSATIYNTTLTGFASGSQTLFPPTLAAFDTRKLYPMVTQYSLTMEKQLPGSTVLSVSYVGNSARHLDQTPNINQPQPNAAVAAGTVNANTVRPYKGYAAINYDVRSASASYNSLQIDARRRFKNGFLFEAAYTYSRSLGSQVGQNQFVNEKGPTAYDRPQSFTLNYVYDLPFFRGRRDLTAYALGGWEVSGVSTFQGGTPVTVTIAADRAGVGNTGQRPNATGPVTYQHGNINSYFSTGNFTQPALGTFGNLGLNTIRQPGLNSTQFNLSKKATFRLVGDTPITAKFEGEFFNLFNHPAFNGLGTTVGTATFGKITSALDPRNVVFRLKFSF